MKRFKNVKGWMFAITGRCSLPREELIKRIEKKGGKVSGDYGQLARETDILVRGQASATWKHGTFGNKEVLAANFIRDGAPLSLILSEDLDRLLAGHAVQEYGYVAGQRIDVLRAEAAARALPLDARATVDVRLEQGRLRLEHLNRDTGRCALCGRTLPVNLLVVGHIKPRARCNSAERRDLKHVAMPNCLLGCDALYERGFVTVSQAGRVVVSRKTFRGRHLSPLLNRLHGRRCEAHCTASEAYFEWHRNNVFIGPTRR